MRLLAIETSTAQGGVAILDSGKILSSRQWLRSQSHSELLTAAIEEILNEAGLQISALDSLAVGVGPGSFTGIRVAISAVKSLSFAKNIPTYCFDSTEVLVAGRPSRDLPVLVAMNAQKNQIFHTVFEASNEDLPKRISPLSVLDSATLVSVSTPHLLLGDGVTELVALNPAFGTFPRPKPEFDLPRAEVLAKLSWTHRASRKPLVWKDVQPLYLRTSGAEEKLRGSNV